MKKLTILCFLLISIGISAQQFTGWGRKQAITINSSQISGTANLTDFPLLVTLDHLDSEIINGGATSALNGGGDIRFSGDADGNFPLAVEVVEFVTSATPANRKCQIWVKVPTVRASSDTTIYIWYNKAGETQPAPNDTYGSQAVWSNYHFVSHDGLYDSATNQNLTVHGNPNIGVTPYGGNSWVGNGTTDFMSLPDGGIDISGSLSISIWKKNTAPTTNFGTSMALYNSTGWLRLISYGNYNSNAAQTWFASEPASNTVGNGARFYPASDPLGWHYFSVTETTLNGSDELFRGDGTVTTQSPIISGYNWHRPAMQDSILLGNAFESTIDDSFLHGELAEARIASFVISPAFSDADYNNMNNPATFASAGVPEAVSSLDTTAPTAPTLSSTVLTDTTVDLSWSGATDDVALAGYNVYQNGSLITTLDNIGTLQVYQVTGLTASTTYNFTVTALDAAGNESVVSNVVVITTDASTTNPPVGELYTQSNAASISNEINSTTGWNGIGVTTVNSVADTDGSSNYSIEITRGNGSGFNAAQTTISNLNNGEQYNVVIRARKDVNNTGNNPFFFNWSGISETINTPVTGSTYEDYIFPITSDGNNLVITVYACDCSVATDKLYISSVSVIPVNNTSNQSPTAPTLTSTSQTDTTVDLSWTAANLVDYSITRYVIQDENDVILEAVNPNVFNYQVTGLSSSTTYKFKVTAINEGGSGATITSNELTVTTNAASSSPSLELTVTSQTDTTVDLSWTASNVAGVTNYFVYQDGVSVANLPSNTSSYIVTGLSSSTSYDFYVSSVNFNNSADNIISNTESVTTNASSGGSTGGTGVWSLNNQDVYYNDGNVGIGTETPDELLSVNGTIHSKEVKVDLNNWPDYVFSKAYNLPTLKEIETYIKENGHLQNIPSAKEVEKEGIQLGEMNAKLLEKIEELTLYLIQQEKELEDQKERNKSLEDRLIKLENALKN